MDKDSCLVVARVGMARAGKKQKATTPRLLIFFFAPSSVLCVGLFLPFTPPPFCIFLATHVMPILFYTLLCSCLLFSFLFPSYPSFLSSSPPSSPSLIPLPLSLPSSLPPSLLLGRWPIFCMGEDFFNLRGKGYSWLVLSPLPPLLPPLLPLSLPPSRPPSLSFSRAHHWFYIALRPEKAMHSLMH